VPAAADLTIIGGPLYGNSWGQGFAYNGGLGNVDFVSVLRLSGGYFEPPVFRDFSDSRWFTPISRRRGGIAVGPSAAQLEFDMWFQSPGETRPPISFLFLAFYSGSRTPGEAFVADWSGPGGQWNLGSAAGWETVTRDEVRDNITATPSPGAALLGVAGLGCLSLVRRRIG
jgi:hypothetical protein